MKVNLKNYNPYEPHQWEAVVIISLAFAILLLLGSSCRTSRSTTDHLQDNTTQEAAKYKENWENDQLYIHQLESQIKEYELAGVTFKTQPCPEVKQPDGKPCPDRPANTVDIKPDGSIHASGDIQSVSISKQKLQQLQEQAAAAQHQKAEKDTDYYYVTRTIDHFHTETVKKRGTPWWVWFILGAATMLIVWLNWKRIQPRLSKLIRLIRAIFLNIKI